jgi:hypothetical protein
VTDFCEDENRTSGSKHSGGFLFQASKLHTMMVYRGHDCNGPRTLDLSTRQGKRLIGTEICSGREYEENNPSITAGTRIPVVQPVTSHFTDRSLTVPRNLEN